MKPEHQWQVKELDAGMPGLRVVMSGYALHARRPEV